MIGNYYWATGIQIHQQYPGNDVSWIAKVDFEDDSHAQIGGSKGALSTKYQTNLLDSTKTIYQDAQKLGIQFKSISGKPNLYVYELVENTPDIWQQIQAVADEIGFEVVNCL